MARAGNVSARRGNRIRFNSVEEATLDMLQFAEPDYLWALLALPVLGGLFYLLHRRRGRLLRQFVSQGLTAQLAPDRSAGKYSLKLGALLLGLGCLILAAANPQVGTRLEEVKREGIDLFVAMDVSLSMKSEDIRPNRLEKAKRDVSNLLGRLSGDRVGLIVFAGDAFVQFPLTSDYSAADLFISAVDVDAVPTPGTMIGSAIELGLKSFPTDAPTQKAMIIVSDGENTEGDLTSAIDHANKQGVKVYCVGMGTIEGAPIPVYNPAGERVDYKRDRSGTIVLTKLDEPMLQQIAASTGGSYRRATSGGDEIDDIFKEISTLQKTEFGSKQLTGFESKYQYPLALAIFLLFLEIMLSERRGTVLRLLRRFLPAAAMILMIVLPSAQTTAQTHRDLVNKGNESFQKGQYADAEAEYKKALQVQPSSPTAQFNLGDAFYKQQRYAEAERAFENSLVTSRDPESTSRALYNTGNGLFKENKLKESIDAYKQALRLNPGDDDARYNLEMARLKQQQQQQQKQDQKKDQKQDQKQNQDQKNKDQQQQKQNEQQKNNQQQNQQQQKQQQQPSVAKKDQIPKDQADRILEALRNSEKEIQKQLRKREGTKIRTDKDW